MLVNFYEKAYGRMVDVKRFAILPTFVHINKDDTEKLIWFQFYFTRYLCTKRCLTYYDMKLIWQPKFNYVYKSDFNYSKRFKDKIINKIKYLLQII